MCWCLRVYWTVFYNLLARFSNSIANVFLSKTNCCFNQHENCAHSEGDEASDGSKLTRQSVQYEPVGDYVIVDDADANYLEISERKIETESYYRLVDRGQAEDILIGRDDGSCLVRPFKKTDPHIKYVVSICAQHQFFHLFIRQSADRKTYGIGQVKNNELLFHNPVDIIEFYSFNFLLCTNKITQIKLKLKPIII